MVQGARHLKLHKLGAWHSVAASWDGLTGCGILINY